MPQEIKTTVGRIVWGNPQKLTQKKDDDGNVIYKDGQPVMVCSFGLAIPKADFLATVWPAMAAEAATIFPNGVPQKFSWKYKDGDGVDGNGKPYSAREGYAGCYVLSISTELGLINCVKLNASGNGYEAMPADSIKTGDYVVAALNLKANKPQNASHTPGLYVNPQLVLFIGYGQPIYSGPDAQTLFGGQQYALPPGASATPIAPANAPGMPGQQPMPGMPGQQPQQGYGAVPPATDFVQNAMGQYGMPGNGQ